MNQFEQEKKFIELRSAGYSLRDIAKMLCKSTATLVRWNKKFFADIETIRRKELDELQLFLLAEKKSRLDFLKTQFNNVKKKLESNEIIMSYEDLVKLSIQISDAIDRCQKQIIFSKSSESEVIIPESQVVDNQLIENEENKTNTK
jgi:hypothetical protein